MNDSQKSISSEALSALVASAKQLFVHSVSDVDRTDFQEALTRFLENTSGLEQASKARDAFVVECLVIPGLVGRPEQFTVIATTLLHLVMHRQMEDSSFGSRVVAAASATQVDKVNQEQETSSLPDSEESQRKKPNRTR